MSDLPQRRDDGYFLDLRAHQKFAVREASSHLAGDEASKVLVVSPTGSGKMNIALEMGIASADRGYDSVFLVHRAEVAKDYVDRAVDLGVKRLDVIIAAYERRDPGAKMHVATYGTIANRVTPPCHVCLADEAHRILAKSHLRTIEQLAPKWTVGFTGSPWRLDRQPLNKFFDKMVVAAQPGALVEAGFLAPAHVWAPPDDVVISVDGVGLRGDDFDLKQLAAAAGKRHLYGAMVEHWKLRASDLLTVAFTAGIANAETLAEEFNAAGIPAMRVDGTMGPEERKTVLRRMASGEIRVATTSDVWIEGVDLPALKCAILARPTLSLTVFLQSVGRTFRPYQGLNAVILDHAGNTKRHGLPQMDRVWSIEPDHKKRRKGPEAPRAKTCPGRDGECRAQLAPTTRVCPECGHVFSRDQTLEVIETELVEVTKVAASKAATESAKRAAFTRFWMAAYRDGHDASWTTRRFAERFGDAPPADWPPPPRPVNTETPAQRQAQLLAWMGVAQRQRLPHSWCLEKYRNRYACDPPPITAAPPPPKPAPAPPEPTAPATTNVKLDF